MNSNEMGNIRNRSNVVASTAVSLPKTVHDNGWAAVKFVNMQDQSRLTAVEDGIDFEMVLAR